MLTKEQSAAAAQALAQQREDRPSPAPRNPFILPIGLLVGGALLGVASAFLAPQAPLARGFALGFIVVAVLAFVRRRRHK